MAAKKRDRSPRKRATDQQSYYRQDANAVAIYDSSRRLLYPHPRVYTRGFMLTPSMTARVRNPQSPIRNHLPSPSPPNPILEGVSLNNWINTKLAGSRCTVEDLWLLANDSSRYMLSCSR